MDYKNGKIYKVQFDDGHFYIGSTATELRKRFWEHRGEKNKSACAKYMKQVGKDSCRIVLIEDYPCENREELRKKEDEHIQLHRENVLCLNILRAFVTPEEAKIQKKVYYEGYKETHKEHIKSYRDEHKEESKEYREMNKEKVRLTNKIYKEEHKEELKVKRRAYREKKKNQAK